MKKIISAALIFTILIFSITMVSYAASEEYSWFCRRCGNKQPPISVEERLISEHGGVCIDRRVSDSDSEKVLYLTFDVGYENGNVEKILDTLKTESVSAAFFVLDNIILRNTDLVTRMADEGHLVCNHTKNHKNISSYTASQIEKNLTDLEKIYEQKTGRQMAKYFRCPEGRYSITALDSVKALGYKTVFWSFAYEDWDNCKQMSDERAINKILGNTHNGAIILLHPTSETNARILPTLIKEWRAMGYTFSTLDSL